MTEENQSRKMTRERLDDILARPILARLATANPDTCQPHVVPVWFGWDGESVYISAFRSTRKVKELQKNRLCSICIDAALENGEMWGIVFEGEAELVTAPQDFLEEMTTRVYAKYLGPEGVLAADPQSWIHDPENLLIKLTPQKTYTWYDPPAEAEKTSKAA